MTINEVRKIKNLKPIEGGEKLIFAGTNEDPEPDSKPEETDAPDAETADQ